MRTSHITTSIFLPVAVLFSSAGIAGSESGFYIGGSVGSSTIELDGQTPTDESFSFSEDDATYKIFGGYNFGIIPLIDLAVEGSYVDLGEGSTTLSTGTAIGYELSGWDAFGLAALTFGPFSVFGKAGVIAWDSDFNIGSVSGSDSGSDAAYGLGAKLQFGSLAARAEIEYFDIGDLNDVYMGSVGLSWTF
jgi:hypothetical protein